MLVKHVERHRIDNAFLKDVIIGMSDGLTVPFALAAGLSGAVDTSQIIVTAGLAEIVAGSISMGLGGYLAARSEVEHYLAERQREINEVNEIPEEEKQEVRDVLQQYGLTENEIQPVLNYFQTRPIKWVDFMMRFELGIEKPAPGRAMSSAWTIGGSYALGGLVPLIPYILVSKAHIALFYSIGLTMIALFAFGYAKGLCTGLQRWRSAFQLLLIGSIAAATSFSIARLLFLTQH